MGEGHLANNLANFELPNYFFTWRTRAVESMQDLNSHITTISVFHQFRQFLNSVFIGIYFAFYHWPRLQAAENTIESALETLLVYGVLLIVPKPTTMSVNDVLR